MNKHLVALGLALLAFGAMPVIALANSGAVTTFEDCQTFSATVTLNHNVSSDRFVRVLTTIPGTVGIAAPGNHYNTSFGKILTLSGPSNGGTVSGTVTLNIYYSNGTPDWLGTTKNGGSRSLVHPERCVKPTPSPSSSPSSSPSPRPTPTPNPTPAPTPTPTGGTSPAATDATPSPGGGGQGQGQGILAASTTAPGLPVAGAGPDDPNGGFMVAFAVALVSVLAIARVVRARR